MMARTHPFGLTPLASLSPAQRALAVSAHGGEGEGISWEWEERSSPHSQKNPSLPLRRTLAGEERVMQGEGKGWGFYAHSRNAGG